MKKSNYFSVAVLLAAFSAFVPAGLFAQASEKPAQKEERRERTIDEIRVEAIRRAQVGQYPLIGLDPGDVKEAFASIKTGDKDEWAAGFTKVSDRYFDEAPWR